jgi:hypothetical protein
MEMAGNKEKFSWKLFFTAVVIIFGYLVGSILPLTLPGKFSRD